MVTSIVSETQAIAVLVGPSPNKVYWCACAIPGFSAVNCDHIEPDFEPCGQGFTAMLRIVKDGKTIARVNALNLDEIRYVQP